MAGRSVSGYVDDAVAHRLVALARAEERTPASVVGQALSFYVALPEVARGSLRRIEQLGMDGERRWFEAELVRLILRADFGLTQRVMASQIPNLPTAETEEDLEAASLEWTAPAGP